MFDSVPVDGADAAERSGWRLGSSILQGPVNAIETEDSKSPDWLCSWDVHAETVKDAQASYDAAQVDGESESPCLLISPTISIAFPGNQ